MPRKKREHCYADYVRVTSPDLNVIAELTKRAKGTRTLSAFARLCGISLPTMSLVVNCKYNFPLSDGMIRAIAENADPESNVTEEVLLEANGMAKKEIRIPITNVQKNQIETGEEQIRFGIFFEKTAKELISMALLKNGYTISHNRETSVFLAPFAKVTPDFEFSTDAFKEYGIEKWSFDTMLTNNVYGEEKLLKKILIVFGSLYMNPSKEKNTKFSFVIDSKRIFDNIRSFFEDKKINNMISIILIDVAKRKIVDEYTIPTTNVEEIKQTLF